MVILYRIARTFGGELNLAVRATIAKLKSAGTYTRTMYICMTIPYYTTKFISAALDQTAKYISSYTCTAPLYRCE